MLDEYFGGTGTAWIDLPSTVGTNPFIYNMSVMADGRVLGAGGYTSIDGVSQPVVVRLLGMDGVDSPGVVGVMQPAVAAQKATNAVVTVRRMGGAAGEVSVAYQTSDYTGDGSAVSGKNYTPVSGRLTWPDGDRSDRQISVPISHASGPAEGPERFRVGLADVQGGVGLGTQEAVIEIAADGSPGGQIGFAQAAVSASKAQGLLQLMVNRTFYDSGAVSVTVTPKGSTTISGYSTTPITLVWGDRDSQSKTIAIDIRNVSVSGANGTFTVELTNPTSGAILGPASVATVTVSSFDGNPGGGGGGGGALDWLALLCLSAVGWLRRRVP